MPVLNFREIPLATGGPSRDQFELFARDFLTTLGLKVLVGPDRGPDAGRDLVVEEIRSGVAGETKVRWLVSCKHKAHSGAAVNPEDEADIHDRVKTHGCAGFLAVYSTIPSSGLAAKLNATTLPFEVLVLDPERIESKILSSLEGALLAERYFPESWTKWRKERPSRAAFFSEEPELQCAHCGKNLLEKEPEGIVVFWSTPSERSRGKHHERVYTCCKGRCDEALKSEQRRSGLIDTWKGIPEIAMPLGYLRWAMAILNTSNAGETYSKDAFNRTKDILINLFPLVARDLTTPEKERMKLESVVPAFLGGWGYDAEEG